jgi:hypothetical protein
MSSVFIKYFHHSYFSPQSFVVELLKNCAYAQSTAGLSYFRDSNAKEIVVLVELHLRLLHFTFKTSVSFYISANV